MPDFDSPPFDLGALMKQAQALQEKLKQTNKIFDLIVRCAGLDLFK